MINSLAVSLICLGGICILIGYFAVQNNNFIATFCIMLFFGLALLIFTMFCKLGLWGRKHLDNSLVGIIFLSSTLGIIFLVTLSSIFSGIFIVSIWETITEKSVDTVLAILLSGLGFVITPYLIGKCVKMLELAKMRSTGKSSPRTLIIERVYKDKTETAAS